MMNRIGIIADDLTGASDTAVQFVRIGWNTELQLRPYATRANVIAVTTDSRNQRAPDAAAAVAAAVTRLREAGITHIYKKIDSTLRGHISAEVQAVMDNWSEGAIAIVCPAFPAAGRTVIDGELRVNGVPVAQTAASIDPVSPVTESHIPTMLQAAHLGCQSSESARDLAGRITRGGRVVVVDATTDDDLRRIADAVVLLGADAIPVGSAGLARHLASAWRTDPAVPALVIVTSLRDVARRQAAAVEGTGAFRYEPAPDDLIDDRAWMRSSSRILDELDESHATLLLTAPTDRSRDLSAAVIPNRFAELAARIITRRARGRVAGIVVTGGDGARALVDALGATGIALRDEVAVGVPIGTLVGGRAEGLPVVTKAGGFGADDVLVHAVQAVQTMHDRRLA